MKRFVMPQLEISEFSMEKVVMASGINSWLPAIEDEAAKVQINFEQLMEM